MFNKQLRFSITLFILSTCFQYAQLQVLDIKTSWRQLDYNKYPPKEGESSYLYYIGSKSDLTGLRIVVKNPPTAQFENETLISGQAAFNYWGNGGLAVDETSAGYAGSTFFRIGVSFQAEDKPETVWAPFSAGTSKSALNDNQWKSFPSTSVTSPVYPPRIMVYTARPTSDPEGVYYVALKDISVTYTFEKSVTVQALSSFTGDSSTEPGSAADSTDSTILSVAAGNTESPMQNVSDQKITSNLSLTCTSENCDAFSIQGSSWQWSDLGFPTKPSKFTQFYTPSFNDSSPLIVRLDKQNNSDACLTVNYWLTEGASLTASLANSSETVELSPTYKSSISNSMYQWNEIQFCLSNYFYELPAGSYDITFTPKMSQGSYIAIGGLTLSSSLLKQKPRIVLDNWSKVSPTNQWSVLPTSSAVIDGSNLDFKLQANQTGVSYLMSDWFKMVKGHQLRATKTVTSCPTKLNITLRIIDANNNAIQTIQETLCSNETVLTTNNLITINTGIEGEVYRLQWLIDWSGEGEESDVKLTFSDVDLSDACRKDSAECNKHGTCKNYVPNQVNCICDTEYFGTKCERIDWCSRTFAYSARENVTGKTYCKTRKGSCDKYNFDPNSHKICGCGDEAYWKHDDKYEFICADLDQCTGVNAFCPEGYACSYNSTTKSASCSECYTGWTMSVNGTCVKSTPCDNACKEGAQCKTYGSKAICYCDNGVTYSADKGCQPDTCTWQIKESLGCKYGCEIDLDTASCTCPAGWNSTVDGKSCDRLFNCTENCPEVGGVCVQEEGTLKQSCDCLPGYIKYTAADGSIQCVNICEAARDANSSAKYPGAIDQVTEICGSSSCSLDSGKVKCDCGLPYVQGADGYCHIRKTCLNGGEGKTECSKIGAQCTPRLTLIPTEKIDYQCTCPPGTVMDEGICIDQCALKSRECLFDNAVCQQSLAPYSSEAECTCQPGLKKNGTDGRCYLVDNSLRTEMIIKLDPKQLSWLEDQTATQFLNLVLTDVATNDQCSRYAPKDIPGCIDYLTEAAMAKYSSQRDQLMEQAIRQTVITNLKSDLTGIFDKLIGDISLIYYERLNGSNGNVWEQIAGDYRVITAIELTSNGEPINYPLEIVDFCHNFTFYDAASAYCFIPNQSVFLRSSIVQTDLKPCNETYIDYCPSNTMCVADTNSSKFSCQCKSGFKPETIIQTDLQSRDFSNEYCVDINECLEEKNVCPQDSTCFNTIGSYVCLCNHEFVDDGHGKCINVCSTKKCEFGDCKVIANNTAICSCFDGYRGELCQEQDPLVITFRRSLIATAVVLGLLLIAAILLGAFCVKKAKKKAANQMSGRAMGEYGKPSVPQRYQDNSGFTND